MKPVYPALHLHMLDSELPAGESDAKGQDVHDPFPDALLYVPVGHAGHAPPLGPEYPTLHMQSVIDVLPLWAWEFEGHAEQVAPLASVSINMSSWHLHALRATLPVREMESAGQCEQFDGPGSVL